MKKALFLFIALILAACASLQVTATSEVIVTLPLPAATIIPTPALTIDQRAKLDETNQSLSGSFIISEDGSMKDTVGNAVEGLSYDIETGTIILQVGIGQVQVASTDISYTADGVKVAGYAFNKETNKWIKIEYQVNTDYKKFQACYVSPEAILDRSYTEYLKTLEWPDFDPASLKFQKFVKAGHNNQYENMTYDFYTAPNYPDPKTRPYQRNVFCYTIYNETYYGVVPTRYYVDGVEPQDYPWVVGLIYLGPVGEGESSAADKQSFVDTYFEEMNFPVYKMTNLLFPPAFTPIPDPLPTAMFEKYPDLQARFDAFIAGDPTVLDGIALPVEDTSLDKYYK